jgi:peptide/nickel transport system permease protein
MDIQRPIPQGRAEDLEAPPLSLGRLAWLRFRRHKMAMFGGGLLLVLLLFSFAGALFLSEGYANLSDTHLRLTSPNSAHPFGTDAIGRDILARTIYGGQISVIIGLSAALVMVFAGILVGSVSGYFGGWIDSVLMRFTEAFISIPRIFLVLVMAKFFGNKVPDITLGATTFSGSVVVIIFIIGLTSWMSLARIVRAEFLSLKESEFVVAARSIGTPTWQIILNHILPNTIAPIVVAATLGVASAIIGESYISFLGLGVQPPTATWGNMLDGAYQYIESAPWLWIFPGGLILLTVLSINFVGDGLRDALDPRSRAV